MVYCACPLPPHGASGPLWYLGLFMPLHVCSRLSFSFGCFGPKTLSERQGECDERNQLNFRIWSFRDLAAIPQKRSGAACSSGRS